MMFKSILTVFALGLSNLGQAATFEKTQDLSKLDLVLEISNEFCEVMVPSNLDCSALGYKIISRKETEAVQNTIKQMIYATGDGYVESVSAKILDKDTNDGARVLEQLNIVMASAGLGNTEIGDSNEAWAVADSLLERLENDVSKNLVFVGGSFEGAFSMDYDFLAIVNLNSNEVVILSAGYSE